MEPKELNNISGYVINYHNYFDKKFDDFFKSRGYELYTKVFIDYIYVKK
jgi:hypothetical protein